MTPPKKATARKATRKAVKALSKPKRTAKVRARRPARKPVKRTATKRIAAQRKGARKRRGVKKRVGRAGRRKTVRTAVRKTVRAVKRVAQKVVSRVRRSAAKRLVKRTATRKTTPRSTALERVLDAQRRKLRPSAKPNPLVARFVRHLDQAIPPAEILLGGSYAKGTYLKGNYDIDVFVRFPRGTPDSAMSEWIARALPKAEALQGSRTYYQQKSGKFLFEIVPVCAIAGPSELLNVTDMSPLHVAHVRGALSDAQKDDVRLAKQFCKAAGVYGAESYVKGFSGYVLELLVAHYGSFEALLRAAAGEGYGAAKDAWPHAHGSKLVLDPARHYRDGHSALLHLNESKTQAPIVLVDPVDRSRNAAAAVGFDSYERLRAAAQSFLDSPSAVAFDTKLSLARVRAAWKSKRLLVVTVKTPKERQDIAGCKVLAVHELAVRRLVENGFPLVHSEWRFGEKESVCWYVLGGLTVPKLTTQRGPPARPDMESAVAAFRAKHPQALMKADESGKQRWFAPVARAYTDARKAVAGAWSGWKPRVRVF